jgi:hypothetical protein
MAKVGSYRIRWANISYSNGRRFTRERMCLAERRYWFGWWPTHDSDWHFDEAQSLRDIQNDKRLRAPLPTTIEVA